MDDLTDRELIAWLRSVASMYAVQGTWHQMLSEAAKRLGERPQVEAGEKCP